MPEGSEVCWKCNGAGQINKYDEGMSSVIHDPALAAYYDCWICGGKGYK